MIKIRKAPERGQTRIGWLDSRHTFSFGDYFDPEHVSFRALRVMNDDRVAPAAGFDTHPDVEISLGLLDKGQQARKALAPGRHAWVQALTGEVQLNGHVLSAGDGAAISGETELAITGKDASEVMVFDLA